LDWRSTSTGCLECLYQVISKIGPFTGFRSREWLVILIADAKARENDDWTGCARFV
jgi:hypothetical protein